MDRLISCEFNMDNACVELKFLDGSMICSRQESFVSIKSAVYKGLHRVGI